VGCRVVGKRDGLEVGMFDGRRLGERVGMIVGAGVVGDEVIMFVGD